MDRPAVQIAGAVLLPNFGGWIGGFMARNNVTSWYKSLKKPSWFPPDWVYGPVWTALYTSMGYASYLVWKEGGGFNDTTKLPFILYAAQLGLNWAWTPLFLGKKHLKASSIWMVTLTGVAATTGFAFYRFSSLAGLLYVPYLTWLSLASALNIIIYQDNPQAIEDKKQ